MDRSNALIPACPAVRAHGERVRTSPLARVAEATLAGVQGIGDWGHDSDGESIDDDVSRDFY